MKNKYIYLNVFNNDDGSDYQTEGDLILDFEDAIVDYLRNIEYHDYKYTLELNMDTKEVKSINLFNEVSAREENDYKSYEECYNEFIGGISSIVK